MALELAEYDPSWPRRFEAEAAAIADALGDLVRQIEHVGSTAVRGLAGKPTVDIAVGVESIDLPRECVERNRGVDKQELIERVVGAP